MEENVCLSEQFDYNIDIDARTNNRIRTRFYKAWRLTFIKPVYETVCGVACIHGTHQGPPIESLRGSFNASSNSLGKRFRHSGSPQTHRANSGLCSQMRPRERLRLVEADSRVTKAGGWRVICVKEIAVVLVKEMEYA
ncbi:hypothetical protein Bca4012_081965 [Brassica carinata]